MDNELLIEAARAGNVAFLYKLLQENPLIFFDAALSSPHESILHIATKAGQLDFIRELLKHNSEAAKELNKDGFRPMDIASAMGKVEIVKELLKVGSEICRLKGRDRRTALHYAAVKGRVEVIDELLSSCPEAIEDVTACSETALHLAVKNYQFDAFRALVKWLERLGLGPVVNWGDGDGNTVLHLAAARKQVESIELLLGQSKAISGTVEVNATNPKGLTPMDVLDIVIESPIDLKLREIFRCAGALAANDLRVIPPAPSPQHDAKTIPTDLKLREIFRCAGALAANDLRVIPPAPSPQHDAKTIPTELELESEDWLEYFKFNASRDSPSDARNVLLVVAALIATVTFQAGVNPPTVILETTSRSEIKSSIFAFLNTLGLSASVSIIQYLTVDFPFQRELLVSIYSLMLTYGFVIAGITAKKVATDLLMAFAFLLPFTLRWLLPWGMKALKRRRRHSGNPALSV